MFLTHLRQTQDRSLPGDVIFMKNMQKSLKIDENHLFFINFAYVHNCVTNLHNAWLVCFYKNMQKHVKMHILAHLQSPWPITSNLTKHVKITNLAKIRVFLCAQKCYQFIDFHCLRITKSSLIFVQIVHKLTPLFLHVSKLRVFD